VTRPEDPRSHLIDFLRSLPSMRGAVADERLARLDSLELLQVAIYLERTYDIRLAGQRVEPDDLRSVDGILSIIARSGV
jgi:hypothetical protein